MAEAFDPYHVWLGIPPAEQPANYYRLLAIPMFEASPDVIDSAADRQTAHLRSFQGGKHGPITQRLLNEVAAARVCLLNAAQKAAYDQKLRARATAATRRAHGEPSGLTAGDPTSPNPGPLNRPPPRRASLTGGATATGTKSMTVASAAATTTDAAWDELLGSTPGSLASAPSKSSARGHAKLRNNRRRNSVTLACAVALVAVGVIVVASHRAARAAHDFRLGSGRSRGCHVDGRRQYGANSSSRNLGLSLLARPTPHCRQAHCLQTVRQNGRRRSGCASKRGHRIRPQSDVGAVVARCRAPRRRVENR